MGGGLRAKRQERHFTLLLPLLSPRLLGPAAATLLWSACWYAWGTEAHLSLCSLEFYRVNDTARCLGTCGGEL